jgi:hypothetical protein
VRACKREGRERKREKRGGRREKEIEERGYEMVVDIGPVWFGGVKI